MYNAYLDIASSLAGAHTGLVQPQKLELVAQCLQACLGRAVEIRQHLVCSHASAVQLSRPVLSCLIVCISAVLDRDLAPTDV